MSLRGRCPARGHANLRRDDIQNLREESLGSIEERLAGGLTEIDKLIETRREKRPGFFAKVQDLGGLGIEVREQLRCIETIDHLPGVLPDGEHAAGFVGRGSIGCRAAHRSSYRVAV